MAQKIGTLKKSWISTIFWALIKLTVFKNDLIYKERKKHSKSKSKR